MTNRTATFTFTNPAEPKVSRVTLGNSRVDKTTAQKATTVMTDIFKLIVAKLHDKYQDDHARLMASKQFTVSFELPVNENKLLLNIFYNEGKNKIEFPLSERTSKSLKESLTTVASSTKASATPYLLKQQDLLLKSTPLIQTKPRATDTSSTKASTTPYLPKQQDLLLTPSEQRPQITEGNIVYRFFAAIFNWVMSFFSSNTSEEPKVNTPLVTKEQTKTTQRSTSASTVQTKTAETRKVAAIRPLRNGNNICFINAIFQALMNMPEIIPVLINAHNEKIKKEAEEIALLEEKIAIEESSYFLPWSSSPKRVQLRELEASREASITLNQALRTYNTTKDIVWLNALRGFDPNFSGWSQEDASDLLDKIFDPLLEPLRNGLNTEGKPSTNIIPENIKAELKTSLSRFVPKFGTRVQWEWDPNVIAPYEKNPTKLPSNGIRVETNIAAILPFAIPDTDKPIKLQDLVTVQLQLQYVQSYNNVFEINGILRNCRATQESLVIQSIEGNAPEYIPLQIKRFNEDRSKNETEIVLPEKNRITVIVDGKTVDYEIHTVVMHNGSTLSGGHYYSYVRKNGAWIEANDQKVAPLSKLPDSVKKEVYKVFLKRVH